MNMAGILAITAVLMFAPQVQASEKTAKQLSDLCISQDQNSESRCMGYIQGFLEGASSIRSETASELLNRVSADLTAEYGWIGGLLDGWIGSTLRQMGQELSAPYCLTGSNPAAQIRTRLGTPGQAYGDTASRWLHQITREEFPCGTAA